MTILLQGRVTVTLLLGWWYLADPHVAHIVPDLAAGPRQGLTGEAARKKHPPKEIRKGEKGLRMKMASQGKVGGERGEKSKSSKRRR
jgi:hypothetical protein